MIIGLSAKKQSGKDETCKIIQKITDLQHGPVSYPRFQNKKFAEKLKQIVALLIGCNRDMLENEEFKDTVLGPEWDVWGAVNPTWKGKYDGKLFATEKECEDYVAKFEVKPGFIQLIPTKFRMTPRKLLQVIGTDCCRNLVHPQIWVNSLMADYQPFNKPKAHSMENWSELYHHPKCGSCGKAFSGYKRQWMCKECIDNAPDVYPDWVVTDCRFPNEAQALKDKGGILIRIERPWFYRLLEDGRHEFSDKEDRSGRVYIMSAYHSKEEAEAKYKEDFNSTAPESETALDNYQDWDYVIFNDGTLEELEEKVKEILVKEGILTDI